MNGSNDNYQPGPDLPMPNQGAVNPIGADHIPGGPNKAETTASAEVSANAPPNPIPPMGPSPLAPPPMPTPTAGPAVPTPIPIPVNDAPPMADDTDLIEKEWVNKAKYIVEATRSDPHLLNKEMNKFKADYIQKRYNKQLKVDEE
jgi:hypothetical protein